jgi:hypothetical protein
MDEFVGNENDVKDGPALSDARDSFECKEADAVDVDELITVALFVSVTATDDVDEC